jgi:predicted metal-dependent peptidase
MEEKRILDGKSEWKKERRCNYMDWMHLTQDSDQWQSIVNAVMTSGSIKGGEFFDQLSECQLLKKNSAPCISLASY